MAPPHKSSEPLTAALFAPAWPPGCVPNGIVTFVGILRPALEDLGITTKIIAGQVDGGPYENVFDLSTLDTEARPSLALRALRKIAPDYVGRGVMASRIAYALEALGGADIIAMEESFGWAFEVRRRTGLPVAVALHGPWFLTGAALGLPHDRAFRSRVRAEGRAIRGVDAVWSMCKYTLDKAGSYYRISLDAAPVIPNPIEPVPAEKCWRRQEAEPDSILFVGRFDRLKGGDTIIDAYRLVLEQRPAARLIFVGPDKQYVDEEGCAYSIERYARQRIPEAVQSGAFEWPGRLPAGELPFFRRRAAVTVVCSRFEVFSYTTLEAAALGCPLVAARVGGLPEIVRHEHSGLLCEPGDAADLATQILRLLGNPEEAERLGAQARSYTLAECRPGRIAAKLAALFENARRNRAALS